MSSLQSVSNGDMELHAVCFYPPSPTPHQSHYHGNISKSNSHSGITANTEECPKRQPVHFHSHSWRSIFRCPPHGHSPVYFPLKANYIAAVQGQTKLLYFKHEHAFTHVCCTTHTHTHIHILPHTDTHKGKDKHLQQLFLLQPETPTVTFDLFVTKCIDMYSQRRFFSLLFYFPPYSGTSAGKSVSAWQTIAFLFFVFFFFHGVFILGWMRFDYKSVFITREMKRPC